MKTKSIVVGITGGIGSGKSTVAKVFSLLGVPVYEADSRAKLIVVQNQELKKDIIALLGAEAYLPDGSYNRAWVASQVFGQPALLQQLNALVHPAVRRDAQDWIIQHQEAPYVLYEAALLKGAGDGNLCHKIISVIAPLDLRVQRVKLRDNRSEEEIRAIIERQLPDAERIKFSDWLIQNDDQTPVIPQILQIHQSLLK
ncbi:dephospho-CoA kinase [Flectobacillus sp. DC10W]|uniref:Dephospho-CoA kinase n=1 Tax=Flectobacillus longus TaxID=2984207 RepID=A0ABT6YPU6_9BACT|nr:dephospho-CoA kinase [Flectobacillus longus]MDI9865181.1 dephospho-CoA kinase [Flectobacillus longus]